MHFSLQAKNKNKNSNHLIITDMKKNIYEAPQVDLVYIKTESAIMGASGHGDDWEDGGED